MFAICYLKYKKPNFILMTYNIRYLFSVTECLNAGRFESVYMLLIRSSICDIKTRPSVSRIFLP